MHRQADWQTRAGATTEELADLVAVAGGVLPEDHLSFLRVSNGGEGPLSVQPFWLVLDPAAEVARTLRESTFGAFFPDLLVIGSNGAGEAIAFDLPPGATASVVFFDMTDIDLSESVQPLAASFTDLLSLVERRPT